MRRETYTWPLKGLKVFSAVECCVLLSLKERDKKSKELATEIKTSTTSIHVALRKLRRLLLVGVWEHREFTSDNRCLLVSLNQLTPLGREVSEKLTEISMLIEQQLRQHTDYVLLQVQDQLQLQQREQEGRQFVY